MKIMKKTLLAIVFAAFAFTANAQSEAGSMFIKPMAGGTLTTLTGDVDHAKMKFGFVGGAEFIYQLSDQFALSGGALYTMQGAKQDYTDIKVNLDYLNIPLLANYYVAPGLAIKAGLQPGFLMSAKAKADDVEVDMKDGLKSFELAIPIGVSYEFDDFVIDARYNFGVTNINKDDASSGWESTGKAHNSVIMLTVGYKIPL